MSENSAMSQEEKIATLSNNMQHLTEGFSDLKDTLKRRDTEIHDHINRKFSDEMKIGLLELEKKMTKDTSSNISKSMDGVKSTIKTWSSILVTTVLLTAGAIVFIQTEKEQNKNEENKITIQQATKLYETVTREVTKSNKAYLKATKTTGSKSEIESIE